MTEAPEKNPDVMDRSGERRYATVNPATGEHLQDFSYLRGAQLDDALESAQRGFWGWRGQPVAARAAVVRRAAELMLERKDELASLQTLEVGKPITAIRS